MKKLFYVLLVAVAVSACSDKMKTLDGTTWTAAKLQYDNDTIDLSTLETFKATHPVLKTLQATGKLEGQDGEIKEMYNEIKNAKARFNANTMYVSMGIDGDDESDSAAYTFDAETGNVSLSAPANASDHFAKDTKCYISEGKQLVMEAKSEGGFMRFFMNKEEKK